MTPLDIKYEIAKKGETIASLAARFGCTRKELSFCINRTRRYPALRRRLARFLGRPKREVFDDRSAGDLSRAA